MKQYKTHLSKEFPNEEFDGLYESYKKYYCVENNLASSTSHPLLRVSTYNINGFNEIIVFTQLAFIRQICRTLTSDDVHPGLGHVADGGVTGVTPGVSQGGVLDQQERGGRGACKQK